MRASNAAADNDSDTAFEDDPPEVASVLSVANLLDFLDEEEELELLEEDEDRLYLRRL